MTLDDVLDAARRLHENHPELSAYVPWPDDLAPGVLAPCPVPATGRIASFALTGSPLTQPLVAAVRATAHLAHWDQLYDPEEVGAEFLKGFACCELFGPTGHFHSETGRGYILYLDSDLHYPWHSHEAEELYLNLAGRARFLLHGDEQDIMPGQVRAHASKQSHAMTTGDQPILTFVLWRGSGLDGASRMDAI